MFNFIKNNLNLFNQSNLDLFLEVNDITQPQYAELSKLMKG